MVDFAGAGAAAGGAGAGIAGAVGAAVAGAGAAGTSIASGGESISVAPAPREKGQPLTVDGSGKQTTTGGENAGENKSADGKDGKGKDEKGDSAKGKQIATQLESELNQMAKGTLDTAENINKAYKEDPAKYQSLLDGVKQKWKTAIDKAGDNPEALKEIKKVRDKIKSNEKDADKVDPEAAKLGKQNEDDIDKMITAAEKKSASKGKDKGAGDKASEAAKGGDDKSSDTKTKVGGSAVGLNSPEAQSAMAAFAASMGGAGGSMVSAGLGALGGLAAGTMGGAQQPSAGKGFSGGGSF